MTAETRQESKEHALWRWVGPLAALVVFATVALILHHQLAHLHVKSVFAHLHAIPRRQVVAALGFTAASYWLLSHLRGAGARLPAPPRALHPHPLHLVHRLLLRAYPRVRRLHRRSHPLPPVRDRGPHRHRRGDRLGVLQPVARDRPGDHLGAVAAARAAARGDACCTCIITCRCWSGRCCLPRWAAYALWACLARGRLEIRGWALRAPGPADRTCADRALGDGPVVVLGGAVVAAAGERAHPLHHLPRRVCGGGDRRHRQPRARGRRGLRGGGAVRAAERARGCAARLAARLPRRVLPGAAGVRHAAVRLEGAVGAARPPRPGAGAGEHVHRAGHTAGRRRSQLPRRCAAAVLGRDSRGR